MKKLVLLLAIAVAFALPGLAQASSGQSSTTTTTKTTTTKSKESGTQSGAAHEGAKTSAAAAKESQLTGCLAKSADGNGFMLTNGRYKKGVAVKSAEDLSGHVGHEVKLTGTWEKPTAGAEGGAGAKGATMRTFNATTMKHVSDTCTTSAGAGGKKGEKKAGEKPSGI